MLNSNPKSEQPARKRKRIPIASTRIAAEPDPLKPLSTRSFAKNAATPGRIGKSGGTRSTKPPMPAGPASSSDPSCQHTGARRQQCRFEMFVLLKTGIPSYFPHQNRTFCFRGDKYTTEELKMLHKLVSLYANKRDQYFHVEFYDNNLPREDGQRLIYKIRGGRVYVNRLDEYRQFLVNTALPEELKWHV